MDVPPTSRAGRTERRRTFAQWAVTTQNPLTPLRTRIDIDRRFREWTQRDPEFTVVWSSGIAATMLATLPPKDPWRRPGPDFGTIHDARDLVYMPRPTEEGDEGWDRSRALIDLSLSPLADPMPPGAARVMAGCAVSPEEGQRAFMTLRDELERRRDARTADIAQAIVLWSVWRRRAYVGGNDDMLSISMMFAWLTYTTRIERGDPYPHAEIAAEVLAASLTDEDYDEASAGL